MQTEWHGHKNRDKWERFNSPHFFFPEGCQKNHLNKECWEAGYTWANGINPQFIPNAKEEKKEKLEQRSKM